MRYVVFFLSFLLIAGGLVSGCGKDNNTDTGKVTVAKDATSGKDSRKSRNKGEKSDSKSELGKKQSKKKLSERPPQRSPRVLSAAVKTKNEEIQACYKKKKNQDPKFAGDLRAMVTVSPEGTVSRVRFRQQNWTNPKLGAEVESCITSVLQTLKFEPIDKNGGSITTSTAYTFK